MQHLGNIENIYCLSFKYLCKTAIDWVNRIIAISRSSGVTCLLKSIWNDP